MTVVNLISVAAMALGLGGILPQLARMARSRSAAGQAPSGWATGLCAHLSMTYVNAAGLHAPILALYTSCSATLCAVALGTVLFLRRAELATA